MPEEGDTIKIDGRVIALVTKFIAPGCDCCLTPGWVRITYLDGSTEDFYEGDDYEVV